MAVSGRKTASPLSSTIVLGSEEDIQLFCQPCDRTGPRLPASWYCLNCKEYLCQSCFSDHKKSAPNRRHILLDKDSMPTTQKTLNVDICKVDEPNVPCSYHKENLINFYCHQHESFICSECKTLEHTNPLCYVVCLQDVSRQTINSKEYKDTLENLEDIANKSETVKIEYERLMNESNSSLERAVDTMRKFKEEMNKRMDELEAAFLDEVKEVSRDNCMKMREIETTCNNVTKSTKTTQESVKELNKSEQGKKLFMELKSARQDMLKNAHLLTELLKNKKKDKTYGFIPNETVELILKQEKKIGRLFLKSDLSAEIYVKTSEDWNRCWITGMALICPDKLILADFLNKSVKLVDVNSKMVIHQINVDGAPCDITKVSSEELAVTLPDEGKIDFLSVGSNKLALKRCFKTEGKFCGISYCTGKGFVVSFDNPAKLGILDSKGNLRSTIQSNSIGEDIFLGPDYVTTNRNSIFVSDRMKKSVIRLNWNGEVTGEYSCKMSCPQGLTVSLDGTVFVCDNSSNSVCAISSDLSGEKMLSDVKRPFAVCVCDDSSQLFISRYTQNRTYDNYIQISQKF